MYLDTPFLGVFLYYLHCLYLLSFSLDSLNGDRRWWTGIRRWMSPSPRGRDENPSHFRFTYPLFPPTNFLMFRWSYKNKGLVGNVWDSKNVSNRLRRKVRTKHKDHGSYHGSYLCQGTDLRTEARGRDGWCPR